MITETNKRLVKIVVQDDKSCSVVSVEKHWINVHNLSPEQAVKVKELAYMMFSEGWQACGEVSRNAVYVASDRKAVPELE